MTQQEFKTKVFSLSERIYPMIVRMIGLSSAEDVIQDVMMKLWNKKDEIENHPNLKGLVFLTARNHCIDLIRKKQKSLDETSNLTLVKSLKEDNSLEFKELNLIIQRIIKKLPQQQRDVFEMKDLDGFETHEVADALEIKQEHVRVLLSRARKQIGVELEKNYNYERGAY